MLFEEYGVRVDGPLERCVLGFAAALIEQSFTRSSVRNHLFILGYASRWLEARGLAPRELTPQRVQDLVRSRRRDGYSSCISQRGLAPMLEYLRAIKIAPEPSLAAMRSHLDRLLARYHEYLINERALATRTVDSRLVIARQFLEQHPREKDVRAIKATGIREFFLKQSRGFTTGSAGNVAIALRSLLRFLHVDGRIPASLIGAVPSISGWRCASLPSTVSPRSLKLLLRSCDRRTLVGRRDFAILTLFTRLGLRACEVARLRLEDLEWRRGEITIHGKGSKTALLPLPDDVGVALTAYLVQRPRVAARTAFLRCRAPLGPLSSSAVTTVVARASRRARLPRVSSHKLRHTFATETLRGGGSLAEIAQVLRHGSLATTAIYAKVDRTALRELVRPWPAGSVK